jgi:hypothetical protein
MMQRQIEASKMAELLTAENFRPHIHKVFRVQGSDHGLTLAAIEARALSEAESKIVPRQPFNLIFAGPPGDILPEGMYTLEVESGPSFELYVMPVHTPVRDRQDYQAAFN